MLVWNTEHSVGNPDIDEQHEHIVELINAVEVAATTGAGASSVDLVLDLLTRYLKLHFSTEERVMRAAGYPELAAHAAEHAWCAAELAKMLASYRAAESSLDDALAFLAAWLQNHTLLRDREFAAWLRSDAISTETGAAPA